jgi:hypothetical protein
MPKAFFRPIRSRAQREDFDLIIRSVHDGLDSETKPKIANWFVEWMDEHHWSKDIQISTRKVINKDGITIYAWPTGPDAEIWKWVSNGTPPHDIEAKRGNFLRFRWDGKGTHRMLTVPYGFQEQARLKHPKGWVSPKRVKNPGIRPRHIEKQIAENPDHIKEFRSDIEKFFKRGIRAAKRNIESRKS